MDTVVLGAGISGLAYAANAVNENVKVYEKENVAGGLCKTYSKDGYTFDAAIHFSFTANEEARSFFDQTPYDAKYPDAYNYYHGSYVRHPVIYNLNGLSSDLKCHGIESFVNRRKDLQVNNYADWLAGSYGQFFKEKFYDVYTKKYWTLPSRDLSTTWIGVRLQEPNLHKILYGAFSEDTGNNYYAKEMRYPLQGGYQTFLKPLVDKADIVTEKDVQTIDIQNRTVLFKDGSKVNYDKLVSSIPLPVLINALPDVPEQIRAAAERLMWSRVSIVTIGFNRPDVAKYLWLYIYDEDIMSARVYSPSMQSKNNAPEGCSSLQFEIYHNNRETIDEKAVIKNTLDAVVKMGVAQPENICFTDYRLLPYGNVIFYNGMEDDRKIVKDYIESQGITLIGRFGEWEYLWSDQSYLSGKHAAQRN